ncbi:MAG: histidine kinase [Rhodospirillales bacterium 20-60-12]|nr:MAG: histidine kinase [Rhodospirillales bacterium 20-60-12]HQT68611.1 sensor domain-containing diguanylate cyclase [Acetobacteraceae bacterium]
MQITLEKLVFFATAEDSALFEHAPIALWAEDFSALKPIFDDWRTQDISDLSLHLRDNPALVKRCAQSIKVLQVNRRGLDMLGAADLDDLISHLPLILRDEVLPAYAQELLQLWAGKTSFSSKSLNYALDGRRIHIRINGTILPGYEADWSRVIVAIEDITAEETASQQLLRSEMHARALFHDSPVSLWVEDFSTIKSLLDGLKARGISDFRTFTDVHPDFIERCMREIHVIDVNQHTLRLFGAPDKATLLASLSDMFRDEMHSHFTGQLIDLWHGKLRHEREVVNYTLNGEKLNLILQFSVMPGHEHDWSMVLIALTDITARKKAEAYLEYLGKHDVLTGLCNRAFYADEINRLDRKGPFPISVIMIDLNGMKSINDGAGHAAGDAILRRTGEILAQTVQEPLCAARIGGDEFVILLPGAGAEQTKIVVDNMLRITALNNQYHSTLPPVSFSIGYATCNEGERMETAVQRADAAMYQSKRDFYTTTPGMDRRGYRGFR